MPESKKDVYVENLIAPVGLPVAYRQFIPYKNKPVPNPPYLIYTITPVKAGGADNKNLYVKKQVTVELYTDAPDAALERKVEDALTTVQWTKYEDYIESESLNMVSYEFEIIEKIRR